MWRNKILLLSIVFMLFSCEKSNQDYAAIENFLTKNYDSIVLEDYKYIVLINDKGACFNCCNSFSKGMIKNIKLDSTLFVVSSTGQNIDISAYIDNKNRDNVIFDKRKKKFNSKIVNSAGIIFLGNNKIDSIVAINLRNLKFHLDNFSNY